MSTDKRQRLLTIILMAHCAGDTETFADAIRCAPINLLSRWERALLRLLPTESEADAATIEARVADGVLDSETFADVLRGIGWGVIRIHHATSNVTTKHAWGTPNERDSATLGRIAA